MRLLLVEGGGEGSLCVCCWGNFVIWEEWRLPSDVLESSPPPAFYYKGSLLDVRGGEVYLGGMVLGS